MGLSYDNCLIEEMESRAEIEGAVAAAGWSWTQ